MIQLARRRQKEAPRKYYPYIYGIKEVGGTDVLFIGPGSPAELGLPTRIKKDPLPRLTRNVLHHVPDVVLFGSVILGGLYWLTNRREIVRRAEGECPKSKEEHD